MNNEKFGKFLCEVRKEKNLTQKELANILHVTDKAVSKWERGKSFPDISLLEPLSKTLDLSIGELLEGKRSKKKENEDLILMAINLYKKELKKKRKRILIITSVLLIIVLGITYLVWHFSQPKYSDSLAFTQEYIPDEGNIKGDIDTARYVALSQDFAIGANQYGYAVFIDNDKEFLRLKKDYKKGIQLIKEEFHCPTLSKNNFICYLNLGIQVTTGTKEEQEQAHFVSSFLDIYANSFSDEAIYNMIDRTASSRPNIPSGWAY